MKWLSGLFGSGKSSQGTKDVPVAKPPTASPKPPKPERSTEAESAENAFKPAPQHTIESPNAEQRLIFVQGRSATNGDPEFAYIAFDAELEKEVRYLLEHQGAIHPFAMILDSGRGTPDTSLIEYMKAAYGYDTVINELSA